ncbi:LysE family translocator [Rhodovulum kholense]|uniref:Threonine/homoserine/homoserine lactone efflux protein n=1 Tax=Rhodovulum kholense TaxID=453584 RepID=A0A8E2VIE6_9RHOB|nr:LysE family translocator [Rhodovulum kholense]PTW47687.1 threonine/homoserine/homoserine lactone efflux protein [Rhodovulum kholense]
MTASAADLALYAGAVLILFLTPGPVWLALTARALSGGFAAAWPLAAGVMVGDALWPPLAIFGLGWAVSVFGGLLAILRLLASALFLTMGLMLILQAGRGIAADSRLTRPGRIAGFLAGMAAILGNPKAILFYMGVLPGFFDIDRLRGPDIAAIVAISVLVPFLGNLTLALFIDRARRLLEEPRTLRRVNQIAGGMLIAVGLVIPFA